MSRANRLLILLIAAEVVVGGSLVVRRLARATPPEADRALLDPATAQELRAAVTTCETPADWRKLGELYMAAGCFREAEACHQEACRLAPDDATFARQWGFALERLAQLDEANAQYRRAIDLGHPDPAGCAYFIGRNHLRADRPAEARAVFAENLKNDANRYELARLRLRAGEFNEAAELLRGLLATRPNALQVHLLGYRLTLERGDLRRARFHADQARYAPAKLLTPFDEEAARVVAVTQALGPGRQWKAGRDLIEQGRLDDAEAVLREAAEVYRSPAVDELTAELALRRGRFEEAVSRFNDFQARHGQSARIIARIGDVWEAAGRPEQARAEWLRAVRLGAGLDLSSAERKLARSFAQAGDEKTAEGHLARAFYHEGRDRLHVGQRREAEEFFARAVKFDPALTQAWFYLGEARRLTGQVGPARVAYQECLRLNPDHGRALAGVELLGDAGK